MFCLSHMPRMCGPFGGDLTALALLGDCLLLALTTLALYDPGLPSTLMAPSPLRTHVPIHQMLLGYLTSEYGPSSGLENPANFFLPSSELQLHLLHCSSRHGCLGKEVSFQVCPSLATLCSPGLPYKAALHLFF